SDRIGHMSSTDQLYGEEVLECALPFGGPWAELPRRKSSRKPSGVSAVTTRLLKTILHRPYCAVK
ncbi:hypothetical protein H0H93_003581, partial [Arthromyces matolae]